MKPTNELRTQGTRNLMELALTVGATRFITQSFMGGYGYGSHRDVLTEDHPFGSTRPVRRVGTHHRRYAFRRGPGAEFARVRGHGDALRALLRARPAARHHAEDDAA